MPISLSIEIGELLAASRQLELTIVQLFTEKLMYADLTAGSARTDMPRSPLPETPGRYSRTEVCCQAWSTKGIVLTDTGIDALVNDSLVGISAYSVQLLPSWAF
jgi:hypothetical protein